MAQSASRVTRSHITAFQAIINCIVWYVLPFLLSAISALLRTCIFPVFSTNLDQKWLYVEMIDRAVTGVPPNAELEKHTRHCAEYLRQSVMCTADNTLERNYMGVLGAFEANNTHVCRDWDKLMEWADENVYTGAT